MKDVPPPASSARYDFPRWTCSAIDGPSGSICGCRATWKQRPIAGSDVWWLRCDHHKGEGAEPIRPDEPFTVTRLELRVAVAALGTDRQRHAIDVSRAIQGLLSDVGAVVVGLRIVGHQASEPVPTGAVGRLELAGPPEGKQRADRPFWGSLDAREWPFWRKRRTG